MVSNEDFTNFLRLGILCHRDDLSNSQTRGNASFNAISSAFHPASFAHLLPDEYNCTSSTAFPEDDDIFSSPSPPSPFPSSSSSSTSASAFSFDFTFTSTPATSISTSATISAGQGTSHHVQDATSSKESMNALDESVSTEHDLSLEDLAYILMKGAYGRKTFLDTNPNVSVGDIAREIVRAIDGLRYAEDEVMSGNIFATSYDDVILSIIALHKTELTTDLDNGLNRAHLYSLPARPMLDEFMEQYGSARAVLWAFARYRSLLLGIEVESAIWTPPCATFFDRMNEGLEVPDAQAMCKVRRQCTLACCGRGSGSRNDWNSVVDLNLNAAATGTGPVQQFDTDFEMSDYSQEAERLQETTMSKKSSPSRNTSPPASVVSTLSSPLSSPPSTVVPLEDSSDDDSDDESYGDAQNIPARKRRIKQSSANPRPNKRARATRATTKPTPAESSTFKNPSTRRKKSNVGAGPSAARKRKAKYGPAARKEESEPLWACKKKGCQVICGNKGDLKRHHESKFHKDPSYQCQKCGFKFTRVDALKRHERAKKCKATDWKEKERIAKEEADKEKAEKKKKKQKMKQEEEDEDDQNEEPESEDEEVKEDEEKEGPPSEGESEIDDEEYEEYESEDDDDNAEDEAPISVKLTTAVWN